MKSQFKYWVALAVTPLFCLLAEVTATPEKNEVHTAKTLEKEVPSLQGAEDSVRATSRTCAECASLCNELVGFTLDSTFSFGSQKDKVVQILLDCSDACEFASKALARGSAFLSPASTICAKACDRCATACKPFEQDHPFIKRVILQCRKCQKDCSDIPGVTL